LIATSPAKRRFRFEIRFFVPARGRTGLSILLSGETFAGREGSPNGIEASEFLIEEQLEVSL
jgi:hypothetical protein